MATKNTITVMTSSSAVTSLLIRADYRFNETNLSTFYIFKVGVSAGPSVSIAVSPDGVNFHNVIEVTAACTATIINYEGNVPYFQITRAAGGPVTTVIAVV